MAGPFATVSQKDRGDFEKKIGGAHWLQQIKVKVAGNCRTRD